MSNRIIPCEQRKSRVKYSIAYAKAHRESFLLHQTKYRAKKVGLPFNLTVEDIVIPERCPMLGLELEWASGKRTDSSPSLDRRTPALGYIKGNVQVISWRANRIKNDATPEELMKIAKYMQRITCQNL